MAKNEGYMLIDHRASPGITWDDIKDLPAHVRDTVPLVGEGQVGEFKTFRCNHCYVQVLPNFSRARERGHCRKCNDFICDGCALQYKLTDECKPFDVVVQAVKGSDKPVAHTLVPFQRGI